MKKLKCNSILSRVITLISGLSLLGIALVWDPFCFVKVAGLSLLVFLFAFGCYLNF